MVVMNNFKTWLVLIVVIITVCMGIKAAEVSFYPSDCKTHPIRIATGQTEGTYYTVGQALRDALSKKIDRPIEVVKTSGSIENLNGVEEGTYEFGIVQSDILHSFREQRGYRHSKVIGAIYREPVYILVRNKLRLSKMDELRGKKVAIGLDGSGTQHTSEIILGIFGISLGELKPYKLTYNEIANSLAKEIIDAAFVVNLRIPDPIEPLIKNNNVYCLKINRGDLAKIASAHSNLYTLLSVKDPKDISKRFLTISVSSVLIVNPTTHEDIVLNFAKQLCDKSFRNSEFFEAYQLYWESYPFLLYREVGKSELFHRTALKYYKDKNLVGKYRLSSIGRFWFPFSLCLTLFFLFLCRRTRLIIQNNSWIWITYTLLVIISVGYFCLYFFESNIGNPDITGLPVDLLKMFLLVFKAGEVFCVTDVGRVVKIVILVASGIFVATMTAKIAAYFVGQKIWEVFKMVPKRNKLTEHVVICNWTSKIEGLIKELRSGLAEKRIIIVLTQPTSRTSDKLPDTPEYDDVYIIIGNPADDRYLQRANISSAHAILILADDEHSDTPDATSLMTLLSVRKVLSLDGNAQKKPNIIVEVLDPVYTNHMYEAGVGEVISYSDLTHKLLAQAIITPEAIGFIREILTTTDESNEVYVLSIPQEYEGLTFQELSNEIDGKYRNTSNPLTLIGIQSKEQLYINPRSEQFSKVNAGDKAVVLAWKQPSPLLGAKRGGKPMDKVQGSNIFEIGTVKVKPHVKSVDAALDDTHRTKQ